MKSLYSFEFARSIDDNDQIIPVRKFKWFTSEHMNAWEDWGVCNQERIELQGKLNRLVVRIKKLNLIENLYCRITRSRQIIQAE